MSFISNISPEIPQRCKLKFLSEGSYGKVHLIIDEDNPQEEKYVIKTVKVSDAMKDRDQKIRELDILKSLNHHRIVPFFGYSQTRFELQLFMGYMKLGSLEMYIKKHGPLDLMKTKQFTFQILEGVSYLHNREPPIIHRDIKGGNILLEDENNLRLTDFGVSKVLSDFTSARTNTGTYNYKAPETFFSGKVYDVKADIWSVGCTVFEMISGTYPYQKTSNTVELIALMQGGVRPDENPTGYSPELKQFQDRCFKLDPQERPSADELLQDNFLRQ